MASEGRVLRGCSVESCPFVHYGRSYCKKHYTQVLRYGRLTPELERGVVRTCEVEGCGRRDTIHGHCRRHARQIRLHGRLTPEREHVMGRVGCTVRGCKGMHRAKGLCSKHYARAHWATMKRRGGRRRRRP
jgi:hypothetical protein